MSHQVNQIILSLEIVFIDQAPDKHRQPPPLGFTLSGEDGNLAPQIHRKRL
jgi:hypothetical protein